MSRLAAVLWLLGLATACRAADSVALVQILRGHSTDFVPPCPSEPKGLLCFGEYYRWDIVVEKTLSGPTLPRHLSAVRVQHAPVLGRKKGVVLVVLEPMSSPSSRKKFRADFIIKELSPPTYCLDESPGQYGLDIAPSETFQVGDGMRVCFDASMLERQK